MQSSSSPANPINSRPPKARSRLPWRWITPVALFLAGLALQRLARERPLIVDHFYSRSFYLILSSAISRVSALFSFSLGEALIVGLPVAGLLLVLWRTHRQLMRGRSGLQIMLSRTCELIWVLAVAFVVFQLVFGLNYQRPPLAAGLQLSSRPATQIELEDIALLIISEVNHNFDEARSLGHTRDEVSSAIERAYQAADLLGASASARFGPPKPVFASRIMTRLGISGIYSPFTGEPNINTNQPESELPFSIAHEKAHQRGYAREDEASFVAFLVCTRSDSPFVRYSGFTRGLRVLAPLRAAVSPERYREIVDQLSAGVRADLQKNAEFWRIARHPLLEKLADRTNNTYLRANGVSSGTANYGEVVSLIIGYYLTYPSAPRQAGTGLDPTTIVSLRPGR